MNLKDKIQDHYPEIKSRYNLLDFLVRGDALSKKFMGRLFDCCDTLICIKKAIIKHDKGKRILKIIYEDLKKNSLGPLKQRIEKTGDNIWSEAIGFFRNIYKNLNNEMHRGSYKLKLNLFDEEIKRK